MKILTIDFELDDHNIFATGEYIEGSETVENIEFQSDQELDEDMEDIVIEYCQNLFEEKIRRDDLEF